MRFALLGLLALLAQQPTAPASFSGYVFETTTGRPIKDVEVTLHPQPTVTVKTGVDGRFQFDNIAPGRYTVTAVSNPNRGYVFKNLDISFAAGENRTDVILRMQGSGTVSGRLLDLNGRAIPGGNIELLWFGYHDLQRDPFGVGGMSMSRSPGVLGDFHLPNVPAGSYFVLASTSSGASFYPGERELARAQRIEVRPEEETRLRDFTVPPALPGWIRLHVVNATGGPLPPNFASRIGITPFGWDVWNVAGAGADMFMLAMENRPTGSPGSDRDVQPSFLGPYTFYAAMQTDAGNVSGYAKVDYSGADVDVDFVVAKLEGQISGRVLLEGSDGATRPLAGAKIEFYGASAESALSDKDGAFQIKGLMNGPYHFSGSFEMPKGYYVAGVREQGRDLTQEILMVTEKTPAIDVRVRADGGSLTGKITDSRSRIVRDAVVALIPQSLLEGRSDRTDTYRIERSDAAGAFELKNLIPGDYLIYAWSSAPDGAVMDPWFMEKYKGKGLPVKVDKSGTATLNLETLDSTL